MAACEFNSVCGFFNDKFEVPEMDKEATKDAYCRSNNLHCARFLVANALGPQNMPPTLLPVEKDKAYKLIAQG